MQPWLKDLDVALDKRLIFFLQPTGFWRQTTQRCSGGRHFCPSKDFSALWRHCPAKSSHSTLWEDEGWLSSSPLV